MRTLHRRNLKILTIASTIFLSLLVFWQSGCTKNEATTGPSSVEILPGGGTPVSDAVRQASIEEVQRRFAALKWDNYDADKASLVQYLLSQPEFEAAEIGEGASVWARYTDGRLLIIAKNRPADDALYQGFQVINPHVSQMRKDIPKSKEARLMSGLGTRFTNSTTVLKSILEANNNYHVSVIDASVDNLKNVAGDGIFYIATHGGGGKKRDKTESYALWTSTLFDTVKDKSLKPDWDAGRLAYFTAEQNAIPGRTDTATAETHFGITEDFVGWYMNFGTNALIYLNACGAYGGDKFRARCVARSGGQTGTVAGWTFTVGNGQASDVAYYVISRFIGFNPSPSSPENPPQRPFTYFLVYQDLVNKKMDKYTNPKDGSVAWFDFTPAPSETGILAPSIKFLSVDESTQQLYIDGFFGTDPRVDGATATVTVDGESRSIVSWDETSIICSIPKFGAGSAGDVVVTAYGHKSNTVQLTEWRGTITFNQPSLGSMGTFYKFDLHFRADVHSFREKPHETPKPTLETDVQFMEDSQGQFSIGGNASLDCPPAGGCTDKFYEIWTPANLNLGILSGGIPQGGFYGLVAFTPQDKKVTMVLFGGIGKGLSSSVAATVSCGTGSETTNTDYTDDGDATVVPPLGFVQMTMSDTYVIRAGQLDVKHIPRGHIPGMCGSSPDSVTAAITWTNFQPKFAPAVDAARKIAVKN